MSHAVSLINAFAASWADALFRACWQGGLGIALVWLLCRLWPALPANPRCWLWRLAYAKLLLGLVWLPPLALPLLPVPSQPAPPPVAQAAAPPVQTLPDDAPLVQGFPDDAPPVATEPAPASFAAPPVTLTAPPPAPAATPQPPPAATPAPPPRPTLPTVQTWLLAVWLLGVSASLGRVASAWRRACALSRASRPLADGALQADAADLSRRLGLRRVPPLHVADGLASPLLLGLGRPTILLPAFVVSGSPRPELRLMLAHELAHLARRDLWWNALPLLAQRLFFFQPLVWLAGLEWSLAQEIACDALAVETTGTPPSDYGRMLLGIATRRRPSAAPLFPTLAVAAPRHTLRRRLHAMQHIGTLSRPRLILAAVLTLALAVGGLLPWRVVAQSGAASAPPAITQKEEAHQMNERAYYAPLNAQADRQLAQLDALFPRILEHLSVGQQRISRLEIARHIAEVAKDQQHLQMLEQHRADYLATHPNRLSDAQIALVQKANWDKAALGRSIRYVPWAQGIERKLQAHLEAAHGSHSRQSWQRQIAAIEQQRQAAEQQIHELGPAIAHEEADMTTIPADQRARVAKLYDYDAEISGYRSISLMEKQARVSVLQQLFVLAGRPYPSYHNQSVTTKAALPLPEAKTASFNAVAIGAPPPLRLAQSGPPLPLPATLQAEEARQVKEDADYAAWEAQADAQFAEALRHVPPARRKEAQARIAFMDEYVAKSQKHTGMMEQHRADYIATHPYRLSNAQRNDITRLLDLNVRRNGLNQSVAMGRILRVKLLADVAAAKDTASKESYRAQIERDDSRRRVAEREMRLLEPRIARQKGVVTLIPQDQRTLMDKLRHYDIDIGCGRMEALTIKRSRVQVLHQLLANKPPRHHPGATTGASFAPPQARAASFSGVAIGEPPALRLAQSEAPQSTPPTDTEKEEEHQVNERAYYAPRNAQADKQLAQLDALFPRVLEHLSVGQQRISRAEIALRIAEVAKSQQHVQMLEQHRAAYLATHPNRLSDAQVALVQKVNWDKGALGRSNRYVMWALGIERKLQAHLEAARSTHSRKSWQRQVAAIEQRRQEAERQTRELGPAIAREEAEVAAIPADQRARVAKLYDYDAELSGYRSISLMDKQARVSVMQQLFVLAGRPYPRHRSQGTTTKTSFAPPAAKTAPFSAVAVGGPPALRLAQFVAASPPVPVGVTQTEAKWEERERKQHADIDSRNAQADAQLAEIQKHLPPAQLKAVQSQIAFANAEYAKEQKRIQISEQSRAAYIASHPNRLSDAQIAFVKTFNWEQMHHSPISGRVRAEMAAIPKDQRNRVAMLRSYDLEISCGRIEALTEKQAWVQVLRRGVAGKEKQPGQPRHTSAAPRGYFARLYSFAPKGHRVQVFTQDSTGQHLILDKVSDGGVTKSPPVPVTMGSKADFVVYDNGRSVKPLSYADGKQVRTKRQNYKALLDSLRRP